MSFTQVTTLIKTMCHFECIASQRGQEKFILNTECKQDADSKAVFAM